MKLGQESMSDFGKLQIKHPQILYISSFFNILGEILLLVAEFYGKHQSQSRTINSFHPSLQAKG